MPQFVEFVTGTWVEGLDADVGHEAEALSGLLTRGVLDAVLALAMFEQARNAPHDHSQAAWERDRQLERIREEELASEDPRDCTAPDFMEWRMRISGQARRDVVRAKWEAGELPDELKHRLPFLHAQTFVTALAQVGRAMYALAELDTGSAKVELLAARDDFAAALPTLKHVRDSVEHAEDRLRGHNRRGQTMTLAPVTNTAVHAPTGGVLIGGMLNGSNFGWTVEGGDYQEVEISETTIEAARSSVQRALDALPWQTHGHPRYVPSR